MTQPSGSVERVVFGNTFSGLLQNGLKGRITPDLEAELRTLGVPVNGPFLPAYPVEIWNQTLDAIAQHVFPQLPRDEAYRAIGRSTVAGIRETLMGRAIEQLLRLMGPKRALARMTQNFRSSDNFAQTRLSELGPGHHQMWINEVLERPTLYQGILEELLVVVQAKHGSVVISRREGASATFEIRFDVG